MSWSSSSSTLSSLKRGEKEELIDYLSRFKLESDVIYRLLGKNFLNEFSEKLPGYATAAGQDEFKKPELEKFIEAGWAEKLKKNPKLWNGSKFRLAGTEKATNPEDTADETYKTLKLG